MIDLDDLIARLEAAEVGSRDLDAGIALLLGAPQTFFGAAFGTAYVDGPNFVDGSASWAGGGRRYYAPDYTSSLDAITSLIGEKFPHAQWNSQRDWHDEAEAMLHLGDDASFCANAKTEPLARCIAFLRAWKETR